MKEEVPLSTVLSLNVEISLEIIGEMGSISSEFTDC
jgi:hypothetical protein